MELLSPAGSFESLIAAVQSGADAVYLGGNMFNARRGAENFDDEKMTEAMDYCHKRNKRVYVTMNTLLFDKELDSALKYASFLHSIGADALIVQDLGFISLLREQLPELDIHASTQMGVCDIEGIRICEELGLKQAVLSREVQLDEIEYICKNSSIPIETFVHGAMCMSFSGGCLMSSMAGERSGNRGTCAQTCRKKACVYNGQKHSDTDGYALSLADLSMIEHIDKLKKAGVYSLKIEGRMKKPEYVAVVTHAYRLAIDGADAKTIAREKQKMLTAFNRGGFTTGYYFGDNQITDCRAQSTQNKDDVKNAQALYQGENIKHKVDFTLNLSVGQVAELRAEFSGKEIIVKGDVVEKANKIQSPDRYAEQVKKLGGTVFECDNCDVEMDEDAFIGVSKINEMRRQAIEQLENMLIKRNDKINVEVPKIHNAEYDFSEANKKIVVKVRTKQQYDEAKKLNADIIIVEPCDYSRLDFECQGTYLALPQFIIKRKDHELIDKLIENNSFAGLEINNIGQIKIAKKHNLKFICSPYLNVLNSYTARKLNEYGAEFVAASLELTSAQCRDVVKTIRNALVWVYGRNINMSLAHCPVRENFGCRNCNGVAGILEDEEHRKFPLSNIKLTDSCILRVLNCKTIDISGMTDNINADGYLLSFFDEDDTDVFKTITDLKNGKVSKGEDITRGHWNRSVI